MGSDRKAQIVKKAEKLFSKRGFHHTTVKMIADSCEITEAALYKYFKSKDEIYSAVLNSISNRIPVERFLKSLENEEDLAKILSLIAEHIIKSYKSHQRTLRLLLYSSLEKHDLCEEMYKSIRMPYIEFIKNKLKQLIKENKIRKVEPEITARCFVGMVFDCSLNLCLWKGFNGQSLDTDATIKNNISIYTKGLLK